MSLYKRLGLAKIFLLGLAIGCRQTAVSTPISSPTVEVAVVVETDEPETLVETAVPTTEDTIRQITILYTNDEHGWMAGLQAGASAANLMGLWRSAEGYQPDGNFLLLSGGDMWGKPLSPPGSRGRAWPR